MDFVTKTEMMKCKVPVGYKEIGSSFEKIVEIPYNSPNIEKLFYVKPCVQIVGVTASDRKAQVNGEIKWETVYIPDKEDSEAKICRAEILSPFEKTVDMEEAKPDRTVEAFAMMENIEYEPVKDENARIRKIKIRSELKIFLKAWQTKNIEYIREIIGNTKDIETLTKKVEIAENTDYETREITISGRMNLPKGYPTIDRVVKMSGKIVDAANEVKENEIDVEGFLFAQSILLHTDQDKTTLFTYEEMIPFSQTFQVEGIKPDDMAQIQYQVEDISAEILHNYEEKPMILEITAEVKVSVRGLRITEKEMIVDVYSTARPLAVVKEKERIRTFKKEEKINRTVKNVITVGKKEDLIGEIAGYDYQAIPYYPYRYEKKPFQDGSIQIIADYFKEQDEDAVALGTAAGEVFYQYNPQLTGENDQVDTLVFVEDVQIKMLSKKEMEAKADLLIDHFIYMMEEIELVKEIGEETAKEACEKFLPKNIPAMVIYVVRQGDTLWEIAKRFGVTVKDILAFNEIQNEDLIYPGQKIIIFPGLTLADNKRNE